MLYIMRIIKHSHPCSFTYANKRSNMIYSVVIYEKLIIVASVISAFILHCNLIVSAEEQRKPNAFAGLKPGEHPLRMSTWKIEIKPYRQFRHRSTQLLFDEIGEEQTLVFDDKRGRVEWIHTGICNTPYNDTRIVNGNDFQSNNLQCDNPMLHVSKSKRRRGRWQLKHGYVIWHLPMRDCKADMRKQDTILHYRAIVHLQKFSERPRMFRGVISRDRFSHSWLPKEWFRPIVATFVASGDSEDTLDLEYRNRDKVYEAAVREAEKSRQT